MLKGGRPVVTPRTTIGRIDEVRRDGCTLKGVALSAGLGALIDYGIDADRVIYKAPRRFKAAQGRPTVTLLRVSF